jgi:hypothetical protein
MPLSSRLPFSSNYHREILLENVASGVLAFLISVTTFGQVASRGKSRVAVLGVDLVTNDRL